MQILGSRRDSRPTCQTQRNLIALHFSFALLEGLNIVGSCFQVRLPFPVTCSMMVIQSFYDPSRNLKIFPADKFCLHFHLQIEPHRCLTGLFTLNFHYKWKESIFDEGLMYYAFLELFFKAIYTNVICCFSFDFFCFFSCSICQQEGKCHFLVKVVLALPLLLLRLLAAAMNSKNMYG